MKLTWDGVLETQGGIGKAKGLLARFLLPGLQDIVFLAMFLAVIALGPRLINVDGDLGRHLTIGGYILDSGRIPTRDLFSHTRYGAALTPHEWLAAVAFSSAYRLAGLGGVVFLSGLLIAATFALLYRQCLERSGQLVASLGFTLFAAAASSLHWLARPHLFTLLLVVVWVEVLERLRTGRTERWWLLPLLMLAWANLHAGFLAGFIVWGVYLVGGLLAGGFHPQGDNRFRLLVAGGLAALAASLANPAGWKLWQTSLGFLGSSYLVGHTAEYFSPNFHLKATWPFLGMIVLSLLLFGSSHRRMPATHLLLVAVWTALALISTRNIPLYAVLAAPVLGGATTFAFNTGERTDRLMKFQQRLEQVDRRFCGHLWPVLGIVVLSAGLVKGGGRDPASKWVRFDSQTFPVAAVDWLETQPDLGSGFNYFPWGGYLLYRLWPAQLVFIDGQTDFYGEDLTREYEQVIKVQPGWESVLQRYRVRWLIMPAGSDLVATVKKGSGWKVLYEDENTAILFAGP